MFIMCYYCLALELVNLKNNPKYDGVTEILIPFVSYSEKESFDSLIRKVIEKNLNKDLHKTEGVRVAIKFMQNNKTALIDQRSAFSSCIVRKIGFPDVIMPEDVRNDIYLTLVSGDFHKGNKKSERNIEVTVTICNEFGQVIENCFQVGDDNTYRSIYSSVVYYHEDKPKWMETIKVSLSIEDFRDSHFKFTFKHRSSNENKDKNERPFALAFLPLMNEDGTTLSDKKFDLAIYKFDSKKWTENDISYLKLVPSKENSIGKLCRMELGRKNSLMVSKQDVRKLLPLYNASTKDVFTVAIVVCSTKLSQNIHIFDLLNWRQKRNDLKQIINDVQQLKGDDVVKFLHDAFDALFEMWMDEETSAQLNNDIFKALVHLIHLLLNKKFRHFQKNLDDYIDKHFSATLVYIKLIDTFQHFAEDTNSEFCFKTVHCMQYIFKFIVRSRTLYCILNEDSNNNFEHLLDKLFCTMISLVIAGSQDVSSDHRNSLDQDGAVSVDNHSQSHSVIVKKCAAAIAQIFPEITLDIASVYNVNKLSKIAGDLLSNVSLYPLECIRRFVTTQLLTNYVECRQILLPVINKKLEHFLTVQMHAENSRGDCRKIEKCLEIVSAVLDILKNSQSSIDEIVDCMDTLFQTMCDAFVYVEKLNNSRCCQHLWTNIIALLQLSTNYKFEKIVVSKSKEEKTLFMKNLMDMFEQVQKKPVYPEDWFDMIAIQNRFVLNLYN